MGNYIKFLLFVSLAFLKPSNAFSNFSYSQLKILIEEKQIQSLDQLLPFLPETLRARFALMHKSQSVQEATPLQPRVLLFSEDGRMGIAFSTSDPKMVEILELNPQTNKMEPHVILFDETGTSKAQIIDDPLTHFPKSHPNHCTRCHSEQLHFNWDTYPRWPGAYGVNNKSLGLFSKEKSSLKQLQKSIDEKSLLRHLPKAKTVSITTLGLRNNSITNQLSRSNAERVVQLLRESPNFSKYRAAIFSALLESSDFTDFLSKEDQEAYEKIYDELQADTKKRIENYEISLDNRQKASGFGSSFFQRIEQGAQHDLPEIDTIVKMRFLADRMGISSADWSMTRAPGTYATQNGLFGLYVDMLSPYIEVLRETDPELLKGKKFSTAYIGGFKEKGSWREVARAVRGKVWTETGEFRNLTCQGFFRFFR